MHNIVLDENVYVASLRFECTGVAADAAAARVVERVQSAHCWVVTAEILRAYKRHEGRNACRGTLTTALIKSLKQVLADRGRSRWIDTDELVVIPGDYHRKDRHVVSAAAAAPASMLVTNDGRLESQLVIEGIPGRQGFLCVTCAGALRLL